MGAPVCNINPKSPVPASKAPQLPSIPIATDLATAIAALNALRQWVTQFMNNPSTFSNDVNIGPGGFIQPKPGAVSPVPPGGVVGVGSNFAEVPTARRTTTTRIYDPNDPTKQTYIDVEQITGLQFANSKTGQRINWSQNP